MYRVIHGILGERFLKVRIHTNEEKAIDKAAELMGKEDEMRTALANAITNTIAYYAELIGTLPIPPCDDHVFKQIKALGNITAKLRSEVARDRNHTVLYYPKAEIGTRLTKQLLKLAQALAIYYEHGDIRGDERQCLLRVARDSIPKQRLKLIRALANEEDYLDSTHVGEISNTPTQTARESLEDLWMLKLLERQGIDTFKWRLNDDTRSLLVESGLLMNTLNKERVNTQNTMYVRINDNRSECS